MSGPDGRLRERYGRWAVVTGASDGIGRAFALRLGALGFDVVLVARRSAVLEALASEVAGRHGIEARCVALDLGQPGSVGTLLSALDGLDVGLFVAAAGFGTSGTFVEADLGEELAMIDVNCRSVAELTHALGQRFVGRRRGAIVLMSSLLAFQGVPRAANYAATKAFVQTLAEGIRIELAPFGVDVVASAPGPIRSGFAARAAMQMGQAGDPAEVARATLGALGRRGTVRPGWLSKLLEASLALLPRWGRVRALGLVMAGMTRHRP